jgi:periplasmic protein TonB
VVAGAGQGLAALGELWLRRRPRKRGAVVGTAVALTVHAAVAVALGRVDTSRLFSTDPTVELEVQEPKPPPPEIRPEPPPPPPEPEKPRLVVHRAPIVPVPDIKPPAEEPPKAGEAPPVFGVTMSSVVAGDSAGMAVPVGNSTMVKPNRAPPRPAATRPAGDPDGLPAAVPEVFIAEQPKVASEVRGDYPPEMQRMGIEGRVVARLYIDENGDVKRVTITERAGHGFDEVARDSLKKFKFTPARTSDGKAVPTNITYKYTFQLPQ